MAAKAKMAAAEMKVLFTYVPQNRRGKEYAANCQVTEPRTRTPWTDTLRQGMTKYCNLRATLGREAPIWADKAQKEGALLPS